MSPPDPAEPTPLDATLFVVSASALSTAAFARLAAAARAAASGPLRLIRLEETGPSLIEALDAMRAEGHRRIRVQPLGLPFPESVLAWLPGVLAHWRSLGQNADTGLVLGPEPGADADALARFVAAARAAPALSVDAVRPKLGKPGWTAPPDYRFHLLICTGPRCMIHGAVPFATMLRDELKAGGVFDRCLITRSGCIYPCNQGPVLVLYPHGHWYRLPDRAATRRFVREVLVAGGGADDLRFHTARAVREPPTSPQTDNLETYPCP